MDANTKAGLQFIQLDAVILRACHNKDCSFFEKQDCPRHSKTEDLGAIAFWHRNPVKRLMYRLSRAIQGKPAGTLENR